MPTYPDESLQSFTTSWWVSSDPNTLEKGRLIWAYLPHVTQVPSALIPEGRSDPRDHAHATFKIAPLTPKLAYQRPKLPVAALPSIENEIYTVYRAKMRPALVVCGEATSLPRELRTGGARWQTTKTILVAPYYGSEHSGARGGWNSELVTRIRKCEYPQYMWDILPISKENNESILKFDHIQPIGADHQSIEIAPFQLSEEAINFLDEWVFWFLNGLFFKEGNLAEIRKTLMEG